MCSSDLGIGKTTAVKILSGTTKLNLGKSEASDAEIKDFFKGNELLRYFDKIGYGDPTKSKVKIAYKPQNLSQLSIDVKVMDLLKKRGGENDTKAHQNNDGSNAPKNTESG